MNGRDNHAGAFIRSGHIPVNYGMNGSGLTQMAQSSDLLNTAITLLQTIQRQSDENTKRIFPLRVYALTINDNTAITSLHYTIEGAKARAEKLVDMERCAWIPDGDTDWTLRFTNCHEIVAAIELLEVSE